MSKTSKVVIETVSVGYESRKTASLEQVIDTFEAANLSLRIAIEQEVESSIDALARDVDQAFDMLMKHECASNTESKKLCSYLMDRFVMTDENKDGMFNRTCMKVLSEI